MASYQALPPPQLFRSHTNQNRGEPGTRMSAWRHFDFVDIGVPLHAHCHGFTIQMHTDGNDSIPVI